MNPRTPVFLAVLASALAAASATLPAPPEAVRRLAERGDPEAQLELGFLYDTGEGVAQDASEAARWYRRAADQGVAVAAFNLGAMYDRGQGVPEDPAEAARWYRRAADAGDAPAKAALGGLYERGRGVERDPSLAAVWYHRAVAGGEASAFLRLGVLYAVGRGVPRDYVEAYKFLELAAREGVRDAAVTRDAVAASMEGSQVSQAKKRVEEWLRKHPPQKK